jgi:hypothetical protein
MYPHTRKQDRLHNLAAYYVSIGFDNIPSDEALNFSEEQRIKIRGWMRELRNDEEMTAKLRGRPWAKGVREALIGKSVGADFRNERDNFLETNDLIEQVRMGVGGRKRKSRKRKQRKSRKRKQRKSRTKY